MKKIVLLVFTCFAFGGSLSASSFTDDFEAATLNPFWTASGVGSATLSTTQAYAGNQSVLLAVSPDFPWAISLSHDYGTNQVGSVSVFASGSGENSSAASIELHDGAGNSLAALQRLAGGGYVAREIPGPEEVDQVYTGPTGTWDELRIDVSLTGIVFSVNGNAFFTDTLIQGFRSVSLEAWGGSSGYEYFDNFSATTTAELPEPAGFVLAGLGLGALLVARAGRRPSAVGSVC